MIGSVIYDAGMLVALAKRLTRAQSQHTEVARYARPVVPGPVLAQVWRDSARERGVLSRHLKDCEVYTGYTEADYKRVGVMLGRVSLARKKRPDVVDALVALTASQRQPAAVLTSDAADINAYLDTLPKSRAVIIAV